MTPDCGAVLRRSFRLCLYTRGGWSNGATSQVTVGEKMTKVTRQLREESAITVQEATELLDVRERAVC